MSDYWFSMVRGALWGWAVGAVIAAVLFVIAGRPLVAIIHAVLALVVFWILVQQRREEQSCDNS